MIIEIKGVQFVNKGAELMLHSVLEQVHVNWPDAQIALKMGPHSPYLQRAKVGAWQKIDLRKHIIDLNGLSYYFPGFLTRQLAKVGIVTEAQIDLVLDASGFAYGDQWPVRQLVYTGKEVARFKRRNKPYIFLPQAFGPFENPAIKQAVSKNWPMAAQIFARDAVSFQFLADLMTDTDGLRQCGDFTNLIAGKKPSSFISARNKVLVIPNSKMMSSRNRRPLWKSNYISMMVNICEQIDSAGFAPLLLNHDGINDGLICKEITELAKCDVDTISLTDPLEVKGAIGEAIAVVSSRFHGCVSALSQGVPCVGTSWSHKYEALFEDYAQKQMLVTTPDEALIPGLVQRLLSEEYRQECQHNEAIELLKTQTRTMWQQVFSLVSQMRGLK